MGLSSELNSAFPDIINIERSLVVKNYTKIPDPNWLAGFTNGEGCFFIGIRKSSALKLGGQIILKFQLTQHSTPWW